MSESVESVEALLAVDAGALDDDDARLELLAGLEALKSRIDARIVRALAAIDAAAPQTGEPATVAELDKQFVREEVACLLHLAPVTAGGRLADARVLVEQLPDTLDLLESGAISFGHARNLVEATGTLDAQTRDKVEASVLAKAPGQTMGEFRRAIKRAVARYDTRSEQARHAVEKATRHVMITPVEHGMSQLSAYLPADGAQLLWERLQADSDTTKLLGDGRTADQRRADALVALAAGQPGRASIEVVISEKTLSGESDEPAELTGYGPVPAGLAREWIKTSYRPPAKLRDRIQRRDRTCRFPGCARNASRCDIDHVIPFNGHNTIEQNLQALCVRHHHLKHEAGWTVTRTQTGVTEWRSPTGRHYEKPPYDRPG